MKNLNFEFYKSAGKYITDFLLTDEEKYIKIAKVPYQSSFTRSYREVIGNSTYFCKEYKGYKVVGKCIPFLKDKPLHFSGLPIPNIVNTENVLNSVPVIEEIFRGLEYNESIKWVLSTRELILVKKYYGYIPYELEYYDSDYYDEIKIALDKIPEKIKKTYKDECLYIRELYDTDIVNNLPEFINELKLRKGKTFHRDSFYNKLIKNYDKYNYKFVGLFCNSKLVAIEGIWINGNVARSDFGMRKKDNNWYRDNKLSTKINRYGFTLFKLGLYPYLISKGVEIYSADGVGYKVANNDGLRVLKEKDYNNKMDRFIITFKKES